MNLVIVGTEPVVVDAVGAAVMGIQPTNVEHLVLAAKKTRNVRFKSDYDPKRNHRQGEKEVS